MSEDLTAVVDRAARAYAAAVGDDFEAVPGFGGRL